MAKENSNIKDVPFRPLRGTEKAIAKRDITDGAIYYAYDSGKIYMDRGNERILMGGGGGTANGASIYYGIYNQLIEEDPDTKLYYYPIASLENKKAFPQIDDIILDEIGSLYRIMKIGDLYYDCELLPLSGGGPGGPTTIKPGLTIHEIENSTIINGQPFDLFFTAKSALDEEEVPLTNTLTINWSLKDGDTEQVYYTGIPIQVPHNERSSLSVGPYLKESTNTIIELFATGLNHDEPSVTRQAPVSTVEMYLEQTSKYNPAFKYDSNNVVLECNAIGELAKILEWKVDGKVVKTEVLGAKSTNPQSLAIPSELSKHGYHTIEVNLYQNLGDNQKPVYGLPADPLRYEIAIVEAGKVSPIIWLGDYQETYYNYDIIQIPFLVYNPENTSSAEVRLKKNDIEIDGSPRTITDFSSYSYWQIADAELNRENYYSIECGKTDATTVVRDISFRVVQDPNRDMTIVKQNSLKLNFDPIGRSNAEPETKRASWSYGPEGEKVNASFENFNWYNNGWYTDSETKNTFLRISNGAKFTIPFEPLEFGTSFNSKQSNAIELAFKIRNIQNYSNLITNITRYNIPATFDDSGKPLTYIRDDAEYTAFTNQSVYTNYDAYLQASLPPEKYDNLEFREVQKNINLANAVFGFYSGSDNNVVGVCVGSQDTFFSNGFDTVNVSFVENEMVYLSFVYEHTPEVGSKLYIYINGCITGVIESSITGDTGFKINSDKIVFNSETCDIDLYKMRIYNTALSVNDIVTNHAVDKKNIIIYDQNNLASENPTLQEFQLNFNKILDYNKEHPEAPLMPYIVYDTTASNTDDKLPYAKANGATPIKVEFVNAPLDAAYARGELVKKAVEDGLLDEHETDQAIIDAAVRVYYEHHCPSWTSTLSTGDTVNIEVQGTSSEFYPRRNFKIKTKFEQEDESNFCCWGDLEDDDGNVIGQGWTENSCLNIYMHKGPYEDIYAIDKEQLKADPHYYGYEESRMADGWYMNNYTNPTDRWTMKVDYMESSGSYNAGFASLMGSAYTKHPLQDYYRAGVLTETSKLESDIFGKIRWEDYRTSLLGYPVMAFQKKNKKGSITGETEYVFIGYYRMLLDKGSNQVLGFKAPKKIKHTLADNKMLREVAECWEFSTNARTFCSYKDPWNRVELSFKAPESIKEDGFIKLEGGKIGGPVVLNHFEPRYFKYKDYLANDEPGFYNFGSLEQDTVDKMCEDLGIPSIDVSSTDAPYLAQDAAVELMKHWEKVCKWIYSTNLDNVSSQGTYKKAPVGKVLYEPGKFYILEDSEYIISYEDFDPEQTYFELVDYEVEIEKLDEEGNPILDAKGEPVTETVTRQTYSNAYATSQKYLYQPNTFYIYVSGAYSFCSDEAFDTALEYYEFISLEDEDIALIADLLVEPATAYDPTAEYYTYNSDATVISGGGKTEAVSYIGRISEEQFAERQYYIPSPKTYSNTTYKYDTKEYRTAKFINELKEHFDLEYLATYFIMTEVFECYDSRGKNCMMASWGPLKEGGDYIWYPIFYDIDTQLGINNTGIPSFEFNVDASEAGNYSTSDSILWNNFYKFFKGSQILNKYKNLRGQDSTYTKLTNPPLKSVDNLEKWYTFNPEVTKNIADRGERPLIATNLDMYFKYITITNPKAESQGVAYIPGADGKYDYDRDGTYFYALQGDRSQSRRQFLTNRLEYIDSWLNQGNYQRGGNNRIRGRISANSGEGGKTSDWWVETDSSPYWVNGQEFGTKTHDFDAEYWLTLKPVRSAYVTAGDDSANYPSQKYDGKNVVKFKLSDIEAGVRKSENYPEQLVYIYGMNQMSDFGDMNKLYWTEFYMEGNADHLTRLQLGYDGYSQTDEGKQWYNQKLNGIKLSTMPLLQEANFSRIGLQTETSLDLTASEKLENFRAVGTSKLTGVSFADGVALNTLYLPSSITSLKLVQANLLTDLIDSDIAPTPTNNDNGTVSPPPQGLYLDGFFGDNFSSSITNLHFNGGSLGYGTYKILKRFYEVTSTPQAGSSQLNRITMKDVNWCPYVKLTEGTVFDYNKTYFINDKHYGFVEWSGEDKNISNFTNLVLNGQLYIYEEGAVNIDDSFITMLMDIHNKNNIYADASSSQAHPIISGIVYVNNNNPIEESFIRNELQPLYPDLTFFFNNVTKAYSAEFLFRNPDTGIDEYVEFKDGSKLPSIQKISQEAYQANNEIFFNNPFELYNPKRTHYVFKGWCTTPTPGASDVIIDKNTQWSALRIDPNEFDYTYYAIFEIDKYTITFYDGDNSVLETKKLDYGTFGISMPASVPYKDDSKLNLTETYSFVGYTDNLLTNAIVNLDQVTVRGNASYYPVFEEISVYDNVHPEYFEITEYGKIKWKGNHTVRGKITIPYSLYNEEEERDIAVTGISGEAFSANNPLYRSQLLGVTHFFWSGTPSPEFTELGDTLRSATQCFYQLTNLVYFEMPSTVKKICQQCFAGCNNLFNNKYSDMDDVAYYMEDFFKNIEDIGARAFTNNGIKDVVLGPNIKKIDVRGLGGGMDTITRRLYLASTSLDLGQCGTLIFDGVDHVYANAKYKDAKAQFGCKNLHILD